LRISEIMSDPAEPGRDAAFEWVELVNYGTEAIDLAGWKLGDGTREQALGSLVVPSGGYAVVAGASAGLPAGIARIATDSGEIGNGLGNDGDTVRLAAPDGTVVDELSYGDDGSVFEPAPGAAGPGDTLGLIDIAADPASENWAVTLRPTPGEPNVFPAETVSTVAGASTAAPAGGSAPGEVRVPVFSESEDGGGGSTASWMVLGGLLGLSAGVAGLKFGPRLRTVGERFRAR
jgi:hypothetical protein